MRAVAVGYPPPMRRRLRTRWVVVAFVVLGAVVALVLIFRDLGSGGTPEDGTLPAPSGPVLGPAESGVA